MFTYAGLITLTPEGREALDKAPEYLEKFKHLIEEEGGVLEETFALMGPWDFLALVKYPDNAAAFRALAKIGLISAAPHSPRPRTALSAGLRIARRRAIM